MTLYDKRLGTVNIDKGGTVYNVKHPDFAGGAKGDGVADDRPAFVAVETFIDANLESLKSGYVPTGIYIIGSNLTLSRAWELAYGAKLKPSSGVVITINGPFSAGPYQVFDLSAGGTVTFGAGTTTSKSEVWAEWWGLSPTASAAANGSAMQTAARTMIGLGELRVGDGVFPMEPWSVLAPVATRSTLAIRGSGRLYLEDAVPGYYGRGTLFDFSAMDPEGSHTYVSISGSITNFYAEVNLLDFSILGPDGEADQPVPQGTQRGLRMEWCLHSEIDVAVGRCYIGIQIVNCFYAYFRNCRLYKNHICAHLGIASNTVKMEHPNMSGSYCGLLITAGTAIAIDSPNLESTDYGIVIENETAMGDVEIRSPYTEDCVQPLRLNTVTFGLAALSGSIRGVTLIGGQWDSGTNPKVVTTSNVEALVFINTGFGPSKVSGPISGAFLTHDRETPDTTWHLYGRINNDPGTFKLHRDTDAVRGGRLVLEDKNGAAHIVSTKTLNGEVWTDIGDRPVTTSEHFGFDSVITIAGSGTDTAWQKVLPDDYSYIFEAEVGLQRVSAVDGAGYKLIATVRVTGGTVTLIGTTQVAVHETTGSADAFFTVIGNQVRINVTTPSSQSHTVRGFVRWIRWANV